MFIDWREIHQGPLGDISTVIAAFEAKGYYPVAITSRLSVLAHAAHEETTVEFIRGLAEENGLELGEWSFLVWDDAPHIPYLAYALFKNEHDALWASLMLS